MSSVTAAPRVFQRRSMGSNSATFPGKAPRQCLTLLLLEPHAGCTPWPAPNTSQATFPAYTQLSQAPVRRQLSSPRPMPAVGGTPRIYPTWIHPCRSARCSVSLANPTLSCRTLSQDHPRSPKHQIYVWQSPTEANKLKSPISKQICHQKPGTCHGWMKDPANNSMWGLDGTGVGGNKTQNKSAVVIFLNK